MIKLVAIDLDGTLLNSDKQIPEANRKAVQQAVAQGVRVVICTGRPMTGVLPYLKELELDEEEYLIINNGCSTYELKNLTLLAHRSLSPDDIDRLYRAQEGLAGVQLTLSDAEGGYLVVGEEPSELVTYDASLVFTKPETISLEAAKTHKSPIFQAMYLGQEKAVDDFQETWENALAQDFNVVRSQDVIFEVLPQGASKASALKDLVEKLGYTPDEIMAIGDANNDIEMLVYAGHSVAMGNAPQHIKDLARYSTSTNDQAGVAQALEQYVLSS